MHCHLAICVAWDLRIVFHLVSLRWLSRTMPPGLAAASGTQSTSVSLESSAEDSKVDKTEPLQLLQLLCVWQILANWKSPQLEISSTSFLRQFLRTARPLETCRDRPKKWALPETSCESPTSPTATRKDPLLDPPKMAVFPNGKMMIRDQPLDLGLSWQSCLSWMHRP